MFTLRLIGLLFLVISTGYTPAAQAQNSSLFQRALSKNENNVSHLQTSSWTYTPPVTPHQIDLHDTIVVRVDELARMQSEGEMDRRLTASYDAVLNDWIRLIGLKAIKPSRQSDGDPRIRGQLRQLYRADGELETRESLAFNIACSIVDIRPNGTLVVEGHRQIIVNNQSWELSLSGVVRRQDIGPDNVVLSRNIAELMIDKRERGHVRDSYKRGWLVRWIDEFGPF